LGRKDLLMKIELMGWYKVQADEEGNVEYLPLSPEEWEFEHARVSDEELWEILDRIAELEAYDWETRW